MVVLQANKNWKQGNPSNAVLDLRAHYPPYMEGS